MLVYIFISADKKVYIKNIHICIPSLLLLSEGIIVYLLNVYKYKELSFVTAKVFSLGCHPHIGIFEAISICGAYVFPAGALNIRSDAFESVFFDAEVGRPFCK